MDDGRMTPLDRFGRRVAAESDASATDAAGVILRARRRALASWEASRVGSRRSRGTVIARLALVAAIALVVGGLALRGSAREPISFLVGSDPAPRVVGAWIAATDEAVPIRFSEGTEVALAAGGRARVTRADRDGARVLLERGSLHARVVHRSDATRWSFEAGPFEVEVVGTELDASWDPQRDVVEVGVVEGRVRVRGPQIEGTQLVASGQRLRVSVRDQRVELGPIAAAAPAEAPIGPAEAAEPAAVTAAASSEPLAGGGGSARVVAPPRTPVPADPDWRALEAKGQHREAMAAVLREGFASVVSRSSSAELVVLADAARYAGDHAHAREALLAARARGARGATAFLLGKIAADHLGSPREAVGWFEATLAEGGGFAEPALGRLIELKRSAGDTAGATAAADQYRRLYPNGSYRSLANAVAAP